MKRITLAILMVVVLLFVGCTVTVNPNQASTPEQTDPTSNPTSGSTDGLSNEPAGGSSDYLSGSPFDEDEIKNMSNEKIECADSYITDVYSNVSMSDDSKPEKVEYKIAQGKDGTKYSAELRYEDYTYYFTLDNENGNNLLSLSTHAGYYGDVFNMLDLNLDGYADIQFLKEEGTLNSIYELYVWDADLQNFVKVECADELLYIELQVHDGYLQLWARNDSSSGEMVKYVWDKNKLVKVSEDEYHADDTASNEVASGDETSDEERVWKFTPTDLKLNGKPILGITYEQLLETFGQPAEIKQYESLAESNHYFYICIYDAFECMFYSQYDGICPSSEDTVLTFDITRNAAHLECQLYIDASEDDLYNGFGITQFYDLNDTKESNDLKNIRTILRNYKPEGYYAEYTKAAIIYSDTASFGDNLDRAMVLLFYNDLNLYRVVFGYPSSN